MEQPTLLINWYAIWAAVIATLAFGLLWYGPLFGKAWDKGMGFTKKKKYPKEMPKIIALQILGLFLTTYVLAHTGQIWRPTVWGVGPDELTNSMYGFSCGAFTWLGFYLPKELEEVIWGKRNWTVFFINLGYSFFQLTNYGADSRQLEIAFDHRGDETPALLAYSSVIQPIIRWF